MLSTVCSAPFTTDAAVLAAFASSVAVWARPAVAVVGIAGKRQAHANWGCGNIPCLAASVIMAAAAMCCACRGV